MTSSRIELPPMDAHNTALVEHLHPSGWKNPTPTGRYNLVVIGAGPAGLVTAAGAAGVGGKVALIEKHLMGGDCLNVGCVPSKCLISSARAAASHRNAETLGIHASTPEVDFEKVMERMRSVRAGIAPNDSVERYQNELNVDVYLGAATFTGSNTVEVGGQTLTFAKAVIATGARAFVPPTPGLAEVGYRTNETIFELETLPKRLAVIGGGPIGCEMAQAFERLGSQVYQFEMAPTIMGREDADAAALLRKQFVDEGISLLEGCAVTRVEPGDTGKRVVYTKADQECAIEVDEILVGVGRAPNVDGLGLEAAGVEYNPKAGIKVDDTLRTTNPRIYAAGDCAMLYKFTHAADAAARIVIQNALFWGRKKLSALTIPWCTYTEPEIAHVGYTEASARDAGVAVDLYRHDLRDTDRGAADGVREGFVKILTKKGTGEIVGATIVADNAGEMLNEVTLAMTAGLGLGVLATVIHPYPTQAEAIKRCADAYNRTRLTPRVAGLLQTILRWRR